VPEGVRRVALLALIIAALGVGALPQALRSLVPDPSRV